jgi:hypothetical protein
MTRRQQLHKALKDLGITNVYFQPPENVKLNFPCIIYKTSKLETEQADNVPYAISTKYNVLYITKDPDDPMVERLAWEFPTIVHINSYVNETLYHHSYNLFY